MRTKTILLLFLVSLAFGASNWREGEGEIKKICLSGHNNLQWQQQEAANAKYMLRVKEQFKTSSSSLIHNFISYIQSQGRQEDQQPFQQYLTAITPQLQSYRSLFTISSFVLASIYIYWVVLVCMKYFKIQFRLGIFNKLAFASKGVKIVLFLCLFSALYLSVLGYKENNKLEQTLSSVTCRLFEYPKQIISGEGPQASFMPYIKSYILNFAGRFESIKQMIQKQYVIKEMIIVGKEIQISQEKQLNGFKKELSEVLATFQNINQTIIKLKLAVLQYNQTLEQSRHLARTYFSYRNMIYKFTQQNLSINNIIKIPSYLGKLFYGIIILFLLYSISILACRNRTASKPAISQSVIQYFLGILAFLCIFIACLNSYVVPIIAQLNPVTDHVALNPNNFRYQFMGIPPPWRQILAQAFPATGGDFTQIDEGRLMRNITYLSQLVQPYYSRQNDYFSTLYEKGVKLSKQPINTKIVIFYNNSALMKQVLKMFKRVKDDIKQLILMDSEGLGKVNISSLGVVLRQIVAAKIPLFNRCYNTRWYCGVIGELTLFSLCLWITLKGCQQSKNELLKQKKEKENNQQKTEDSVQRMAQMINDSN